MNPDAATDAATGMLAPQRLETPMTSREEWLIEPLSGGIRRRGRELWQYRRLLRFFGLKAVQKLYARTKLGWVWIFIRPLFPLLTKTLIFGSVLSVGSDGVPYFLFLVASSTGWELFASAVTWGTRSLEMNRSMLRQMYLPRLILPLANMTPAFLTFAIYLSVLALAFVWFGIADGRMYFVPAGLGWTLAATVLSVTLAFAIALWTSVPALVARDVRFTVGYVLGFWVFLTPVMYPLSAVPPHLRSWMLLNPMAPIVESFKFGLLGIGGVELWQLGVSALLVLVLLASGLVFFSRAEADAADRV
jgi:lipopolysaccharide transport system permease protein